MAEAVEKITGKPIKYYVLSVIGVAIMVFFGMIPAPEPMTQLGMQVCGQFIGLLFLWIFVDMVWPTFLGIVMFGMISQQVYPNSFAMAGIYEAGAQSIGCWIVVMVLGLLLLVEVLSETGLIRRFALYFITRKAARKSGWSFTFMFFLAAFIVALFLNIAASQVIMLALAKEVFEICGVTKEDKWPRVITIGTTFVCVVGYIVTPFCHDVTLLFMGIYTGITGEMPNWLSFMGIGLPIAVIILLIMFVYFKLIVKPDMSKIEKVDFQKIEALRPGKMTPKENFVATVFIVLIIVWVIPGFLSAFAANAGITAWFNAITMVSPLYIAIVLLAVVHFDGKPVLVIPEAAKNISWLMIFFLAGIMMIASAMGEDTTGISAWVMTIIQPLVENLSPFAFIAALSAISVILTNVANNIPVGIIFITIGVPLSLQMGINPFITAAAVTISSQMSFTIPPSFVPIGICYADPYGGGHYTLRWGVVMAVVAAILCALLIYPLATIFA